MKFINKIKKKILEKKESDHTSKEYNDMLESTFCDTCAFSDPEFFRKSSLRE